MHKVLTRLLTVPNHVEARVFLRLDPQQGSVSLSLQQGITLSLPLGPEFVGLGQPFGFGQATSDGG